MCIQFFKHSDPLLFVRKKCLFVKTKITPRKIGVALNGSLMAINARSNTLEMFPTNTFWLSLSLSLSLSISLYLSLSASLSFSEGKIGAQTDGSEKEYWIDNKKGRNIEQE